MAAPAPGQNAERTWAGTCTAKLANPFASTASVGMRGMSGTGASGRGDVGSLWRTLGISGCESHLEVWHEHAGEHDGADREGHPPADRPAGRADGLGMGAAAGGGVGGPGDP